MPLLDRVDREIPFADWPGLAQGSVPGHACNYITGWSGGRRVVLQSGRLHLYEGISTAQILKTVDIMAELGTQRIVFTNAVGGLLPTLQPGMLVAADSVRCWPCRRWTPATAPPISLRIRGCDAVGAYAWMHGPCYETTAEIHALQTLGAATVGMSSALELEYCATLGIKAGLISCVTNACLSGEVLCHEQVVAVAQRSSQRLCRLLRAFLAG